MKPVPLGIEHYFAVQSSPGNWAACKEQAKGNEWGTYQELSRTLLTYHGMAYGTRVLGSRSFHSSQR